MGMKINNVVHCGISQCPGYLIPVQKKEEISTKTKPDMIIKNEHLYKCSECTMKYYPGDLEIV